MELQPGTADSTRAWESSQSGTRGPPASDSPQRSWHGPVASMGQLREPLALEMGRNRLILRPDAALQGGRRSEAFSRAIGPGLPSGWAVSWSQAAGDDEGDAGDTTTSSAGSAAVSRTGRPHDLAMAAAIRAVSGDGGSTLADMLEDESPATAPATFEILGRRVTLCPTENCSLRDLMYRWAQCYPEGRPSSAAQAGHAVSDSKAAGDAGDEEDEDAFNIFGPGVSHSAAAWCCDMRAVLPRTPHLVPLAAWEGHGCKRDCHQCPCSPAPQSLPPPLPHTQASLARVRPVRRELSISHILGLDSPRPSLPSLLHNHLTYFRDLKAWHRDQALFRQSRFLHRMAALGIDPRAQSWSTELSDSWAQSAFRAAAQASFAEAEAAAAGSDRSSDKHICGSDQAPSAPSSSSSPGAAPADRCGAPVAPRTPAAPHRAPAHASLAFLSPAAQRAALHQLTVSLSPPGAASPFPDALWSPPPSRAGRPSGSPAASSAGSNPPSLSPARPAGVPASSPLAVSALRQGLGAVTRGGGLRNSRELSS